MSDLNDEDSQSQGILDLESNNPHYSLVDSTMDLTRQIIEKIKKTTGFSIPHIGVPPHHIVKTVPPTSLTTKVQLDAALSRMTIYQAQPPIRACRCVMHYR